MNEQNFETVKSKKFFSKIDWAAFWTATLAAFLVYFFTLGPSVGLEDSHSMEPRIHDGDYCLFQRYQGGSREGKIILAEHQGSVDSEYEGSYSIKQYHSTKKYNEFGEWEHESIALHPLNRLYEPIILSPEDIEDFCIIGEFVKVV